MSLINITPDMWQPIHEDERKIESIDRPVTTFWKAVWIRFIQNKLAFISLLFMIVIIAMALFGPMVCRYSFDHQDLNSINMLPNADHWFGTDHLGRDLFVRVLIGARISLLIAFIAMLVNLFIGVIYGSIAGYVGGLTDMVMMRFVDIIDTIPLVLYAILIMVVLGTERSLINMIIALASVYWVNMARIVRGQIMVLKEQEFIMAAKILGAGPVRILTKHLIPNMIGVIIVTMTLFIPTAIFTEAFLSFIGLGVTPPMTSWGALINEGVDGVRSFPYQLLFPSAVLCITMFALNFLGDGLRNSMGTNDYGKR